MRFLILTLAILCITGCSSVRTIPNPFGSKVDKMPSQVIAVWTPACRNGTQERGFAGRVTFYNSKSQKGLKIEGDLLVCGYDDYIGRPENDVRPDHTYPFLKDDLQKLHSYDKNSGHSYSLWVPWDSLGIEGETKNVSLLVKYVPKGGSAILSGLAKCQLPGKEVPEFLADAQHTAKQGDITQVSLSRNLKDEYYDSIIYSDSNPDEYARKPRRMSTSTINLQSGLAGTQNYENENPSQIWPNQNQYIQEYRNQTNQQLIQNPQLNSNLNWDSNQQYQPGVGATNYYSNPQPTDIVPQSYMYQQDIYDQQNFSDYRDFSAQQYSAGPNNNPLSRQPEFIGSREQYYPVNNQVRY
ncbi:MAG: hypothetical protein ACRC2T_00695 [Thermoguttaceae bacterium]